MSNRTSRQRTSKQSARPSTPAPTPPIPTGNATLEPGPIQNSVYWCFPKGLSATGCDRINHQLSELARVLQQGGDQAVLAVEEALDAVLSPPVRPGWRRTWDNYRRGLVPNGWFFGESLAEDEWDALHTAVVGMIRFARCQSPRKREIYRRKALDLVRDYLKLVGEFVPEGVGQSSEADAASGKLSRQTDTDLLVT